MASKSTKRPASSAQTGKAGRKRPTPAPAKNPLPWGMISAVLGVVLAAGLLVGLPLYLTSEGETDGEQVEGPVPDGDVKGVVDYYKKGAGWVDDSEHPQDPQKYELDPPAGGNHHPVWQTCVGSVYDKPIPNEHAVHSLEHGAVWITYQPDADDKVTDALAKKVEGQDYMLMSPYEKQQAPITLTAWGYQLQLEKPDDKRIDEFIETYRLEASRERGAACSDGVNATGDKPVSGAGM